MQVTTDFASASHQAKRRQQRPPSAIVNREFIQESLGRGRNATAIWQDLVTDYGFRTAIKVSNASLTNSSQS